MYKKPSFRGAKPRYGNNNRKNDRGGRQRNKQTIHESKFINRQVKSLEAPVVTEESRALFADFALAAPIQRNVAATGFISPTAIQLKTIPLALEGKDIIGLANTGTGKTAAFLLPILHALHNNATLESVLIMAPTRELAQQIEDEFRKFSQGMRLFSVLLVGGVNITPQLRKLARRPHIIIGTPGRIKDHLDRGSLKLDHVEYFVLDEADRMLDMGFVHDIRKIASLLPAQKQTLCFSATFNDAIKRITADFMHNPEVVSVKVTETNDHIYQDIVHYNDADHKKELLLNMLGEDKYERVIVFGETKFGVQRLSDTMDKQGIASRAIHGNKSQGQRNKALEDFKNSKARVLVATDVAARGLDIRDVSHVINFDIPQTYDDYVHRIGRTGRGGKSGVALTFVRK